MPTCYVGSVDDTQCKEFTRGDFGCLESRERWQEMYSWVRLPVRISHVDVKLPARGCLILSCYIISLDYLQYEF